MNEHDDIDAVAAEYVLGTLDASERASVAARRHRELRLDAAIVDWERRLAPLAEASAAIAPPPGLFQKIEARLLTAGDRPSARSGPEAGNLVKQLETRVTRWRRTAIASSLIAASLAFLVAARETLVPRSPQSFVAVFQKDDVLPAFLLSIDLVSRELTIRPVAAPQQPGKTYQLWIVSEQTGPKPHSLGLLADALEPTRKTLASFEPAVLRRATFGISVEPAGGSPTGTPTGQALHGKLHPAAP